ncbi:MAG TPA: N-acetylmuramoyl-L-alanine amidase, partial [Pseudolabrys sp.]|nr:N-acetylmuramoyl-L-alanine amidase [Pseudolabrys sp.]
MTFRLGLIACLTGAVLLSAAATRAAEPAKTAQALPVANDVRVGGDDKATRFVLDLTQKVDIAAFTLADPYR